MKTPQRDGLGWVLIGLISLNIFFNLAVVFHETVSSIWSNSKTKKIEKTRENQMKVYLQERTKITQLNKDIFKDMKFAIEFDKALEFCIYWKP